MKNFKVIFSRSIFCFRTKKRVYFAFLNKQLRIGAAPRLKDAFKWLPLRASRLGAPRARFIKHSFYYRWMWSFQIWVFIWEWIIVSRIVQWASISRIVQWNISYGGIAIFIIVIGFQNVSSIFHVTIVKKSWIYLE